MKTAENFDTYVEWRAYEDGVSASAKTLRDQFAMHAINMLYWSKNEEYCAKAAYKMADAMLKAREAK